MWTEETLAIQVEGQHALSQKKKKLEVNMAHFSCHRLVNTLSFVLRMNEYVEKCGRPPIIQPVRWLFFFYIIFIFFIKIISNFFFKSTLLKNILRILFNKTFLLLVIWFILSIWLLYYQPIYYIYRALQFTTDSLELNIKYVFKFIYAKMNLGYDSWEIWGTMYSS